MTSPAQPTLEDLRDAPAAAWLWDAARLRIVWANRAGLRIFGCETLFDLIDRPFDANEPGAAAIRANAQSARTSAGRAIKLSFPSSETPGEFDATIYPHTLSDGRMGVLAIAAGPLAPHPENAGAIQSAFELHPQAILILDAAGASLEANRAAFDLLPQASRWSLAGLLGSDSAAEDLLGKLAAAGTVSAVRSVETRHGRRDIRITGRRLGDPAGFASVLLDDVTDRRELERSLSTRLPAAASYRQADTDVEALSEEEHAVFAELGRKLGRGPMAPPTTARISPIPDFIRLKLDTAPGANIFVKDGAIIHASPAALAILRYDSLQALQEVDGIVGMLAGGGEDARLPAGDGSTVHAEVARESFPWVGGPGDQYTLAELSQASEDGEPETVAATEIIAEAPVEIAEPVPAPPPPLVEPAPLAPEPVAFERAAPAARHEPRKFSALPDFPPLPELIPVRRTLPPPSLLPTPEPPALEPVAAAPTPEPPPAAAAAPLVLERVVAATNSNEHDSELRAVLDTVADGIITLDASGAIRSFSAGAESIFGYRTAEVLDKPLAGLLAQESRKTVRDYMASLGQPGLKSLLNDGREVTALERNGGEVPLFLTIGRMERPGAAAHYCAVVRDITQWKKTEQDLREARDAAEHVSRQKSDFLARISHELRTPLNAILGFSEVMQLERFGEIRNDRYRGYVNDIHTSGSHLLSLINDLLDLSKVESGKLELNFTAVNLGEVTDHAIRLVQEQAASARVILRKAIPPDMPNVVADLRSMRQIMLNLLSNAIKFTDAGGQVVVSAQLKGSGEMILRVKDTGIGMNDAQVRDALEPFRRVTTEGRDTPGTGLGLPLTKALAEANRAVFDIESEPRKGTTIELIFPTTRVLAG